MSVQLKGVKMKLSDYKVALKNSRTIPTKPILEYLSNYQGDWTSLWSGYFKETDPEQTDVYYSMPEGTSREAALFKLRKLHRLGLIGGCPCGCRGDFEITDKGLFYINKIRTVPYSGYGQGANSTVTEVDIFNRDLKKLLE